jgi:ferredoxin/flavodoxin---NADP+ reductase
VCAELGLPPLEAGTDRVMICGNMRMLADARHLLERLHFEISPQIGIAGDYLIERAFVEAAVQADSLSARASAA